MQAVLTLYNRIFSYFAKNLMIHNTMKSNYLLSLLLLIGISFGAVAQKKASPGIKKCHLPSDSTILLKVTLNQAKAWADSLPLKMICDDLKTYKLFNFDFTLITMNPFQNKEFGTGNGGIPLLARKAIDQLKPKDAIILKNATYKDAKGIEQKLPIISFSIIE